MMKKSSSRLIAWLLAMVMILNIAPVTALADVPSGPYTPNYEAPVSKFAKSGDPYYTIVKYVHLPDGTVEEYQSQGYYYGANSAQVSAPYYDYRYTATPSQLTVTKNSNYGEFAIFHYYPVEWNYTVHYQYKPENNYVDIPGYPAQSLTGAATSSIDPVITIPGYSFESCTPGSPFILDNNNKDVYVYYKKAAEDTTTPHTVTFIYNNGQPSTTQTVINGQKATRPEDPEKTGFEFTGWTNNNNTFNFDSPIYDDIVLRAKYSDPNYINEDPDHNPNGKNIHFTITVDAVGTAAGANHSPEDHDHRELESWNDRIYVHNWNTDKATFSHWSIEIDGQEVANWRMDTEGFYPNMDDDPNANGKWTTRTYVAHFIPTDGTLMYTVIWKNGDTPLETDSNLVVGTMPHYDGAEPTKDSDALYDYSFSGWSPQVHAVTDNQIYLAQFSETLRSYDVTYILDGTTYGQVDTVQIGTNVTLRSDPVQNGRDFNGWKIDNQTASDFVMPAHDVVITGTSSPKQYEITWLNEDGSLIEKTTVTHGTVPTHADASKTATKEWTYTFTGWDNDPVAATSAATYKATFNATKNSYTITFKNADGTVLQSSEVAYGETPAYAGEDPTKAPTADKVYTFKGWTPEVEAVTGEAIYTATYDESARKYAITFKNADGTVLQSSEVAYGETPAYDGEDPTKAPTADKVYTFKGWTPEVEAVTGEATYTATYSESVREYTITWQYEDGTAIDTTEVKYGEVPTHEDPTKADDDTYTYTFDSWSPELVKVTGEATYKATFKAEVKPIDLYNVATVVGPNNQKSYWRLRKQENGIKTDAPLSEYVKNLTDIKQQNVLSKTPNISGTKVIEIVPYNFENEILTKGGLEYVYREEGFKQDPENPIRYYTAKPVKDEYVAAGKKIGGASGSLVKDYSCDDTDPRDCIKRNWEIRFYDVIEDQPLYNFLQIDGNADYNFYRLKIQTIKIGIKATEITTDGDVNKTLYPYTCEPGEYDFTKLKITIDDITYSYKDKNYKPTGEDFEPYYTVEYKGVRVWNYIHGKSDLQLYTDWLNNPNAQLDGDPWGITVNKTRVYHRDYKATLHAPEVQKVKLVAKSDEKTYNGNLQTITGYDVYLGTKKLDKYIYIYIYIRYLIFNIRRILLCQLTKMNLQKNWLRKLFSVRMLMHSSH